MHGLRDEYLLRDVWSGFMLLFKDNALAFLPLKISIDVYLNIDKDTGGWGYTLSCLGRTKSPQEMDCGYCVTESTGTTIWDSSYSVIFFLSMNKNELSLELTVGGSSCTETKNICRVCHLTVLGKIQSNQGATKARKCWWYNRVSHHFWSHN